MVNENVSKKNNKTPSSPTLNTVIMVEETIKNSEDSLVTVAELKKSLPKQINHNTLKVILRYLDKSNKIYMSVDGIVWIHNTSKKLKEAINRGLEL